MGITAAWALFGAAAGRFKASMLTPSNPGLGALNMDGTGLFGTGIFGQTVTVTNLSTWTFAEYGAVGLGAFTAFSLFSTTKSGVRRATSSKSKKAAQGAVNTGSLIIAAAAVGVVGYMLVNKVGGLP